MGSCRSKNDIISPRLSSLKCDTLRINPNVYITESKRALLDVYKIGKILGRGGFSEVRLLTHLETKVEYAVKILRKNQYTAKNEENFHAEIEILRSLDHPNIIKIIEYFEDEKRLYIVMEKCEGGELYEQILQANHFSEDAAARLMKQLLSAVWYIHERQVVHRDIKPENIMFETRGELFNIKLIDFGVSMKLKDSKSTNEIVGAVFYISPEALNGKYSAKCDLWSCGVIAYMLLCGVPPFAGENEREVFKKINKMKVQFNQHVWRSLSSYSQDFINKLICSESSRMSAAEALQHPWIVDVEAPSPVKEVFQPVLRSLHSFHSKNKLKELVYIQS